MEAVDMLAAEMQLNHPKAVSIFSVADVKAMTRCGGCGSHVILTEVDDRGRTVKVFACGHRYVIGQRAVSIERV